MLSAVILTLAVGSGPATMSIPVIAAQDETQTTPPVDVAPAGIGQEPEASFDTSLSFAAGFTWQFETDMNEPGKLSHGRFGIVGVHRSFASSSTL